MSVVAVFVAAGLLMGLVAFCCCPGEHPVARTTTVAAVLMDTGADQHAAGSGDGCEHPADHPTAVVAPGSAITRDAVPRDLASDVVAAVHRPTGAASGPVNTAGGVPARAPASHLLCIMRT